MPSNGSVTASQVDISLPVIRPQEIGTSTPELGAGLRAHQASYVQTKSTNAIDAEFYPHGKRSLSGIAVRAFCLGAAAIVGITGSILAIYSGSLLWRPCLFLATLSIFHFLEFYTTAAYNTPIAWVASFLLTNGDQYRIAHSMAFVETTITSYFLAGWNVPLRSPWVMALGTILIILGQVVRSIAMAQAGTNFNHQVQSRKNDGHELVTTGLYAYFRHPSYFGFFWWGVGTQLMLGNTICFVAYAAVLWLFFSRRISRKSFSRTLVFYVLMIVQMKRSISFRSLETITRHTSSAHASGFLSSDQVWASAYWICP